MEIIMSWMLGLVIVLIVIASLLLKNKPTSNTLQYEKQKVLFSPAERSFLGVLTLALEENALIFGKVRVADILKPIKGVSRKNWQSLFNKISSKHFDFVICDKNDLSVLCVIELDDKSHNSKSRIKRDEFLQSACESADLALIRVPAQSDYDLEDIRQTLIKHLS
jgi:hypothetical protein